jgi:hypothetical protein
MVSRPSALLPSHPRRRQGSAVGGPQVMSTSRRGIEEAAAGTGARGSSTREQRRTVTTKRDHSRPPCSTEYGLRVFVRSSGQLQLQDASSSKTSPWPAPRAPRAPNRWPSPAPARCTSCRLAAFGDPSDAGTKPTPTPTPLEPRHDHHHHPSNLHLQTIRPSVTLLLPTTTWMPHFNTSRPHPARPSPHVTSPHRQKRRPAHTPHTFGQTSLTRRWPPPRSDLWHETTVSLRSPEIHPHAPSHSGANERDSGGNPYRSPLSPPAASQTPSPPSETCDGGKPENRLAHHLTPTTSTPHNLNNPSSMGPSPLPA